MRDYYLQQVGKAWSEFLQAWLAVEITDRHRLLCDTDQWRTLYASSSDRGSFGGQVARSELLEEASIANFLTATNSCLSSFNLMLDRRPHTDTLWSFVVTLLQTVASV